MGTGWFEAKVRGGNDAFVEIAQVNTFPSSLNIETTHHSHDNKYDHMGIGVCSSISFYELIYSKMYNVHYCMSRGWLAP